MEHSIIQRLNETQIRDFPYEDLAQWASDFTAGANLSTEAVSAIVESVKQNQYILVTGFALDFVLAFFKRNYSDIDWQLVDCEVLKEYIANDTIPNVLIWSFNGVYHCAWINSRQKVTVTDTLTAFDAGVETDYMQSLNIDALQDVIPNLETRNHLIFLGLIEGGDIEIIPLTSATLSINESTARFSDAIWFNEIQKKSIIVAGCGGIGSYVIFLLSRMQPKRLFIYDDDVVEMVNMAGQLYSIKDIRLHKVDAIATMVHDYSIYNNIVAIRERFTETTEALDIMICGFDNMIARRDFFNSWKNHVATKSEEERKHCLFIDGRLAAEEFQVLCIRGDDEYNINKYNTDFLFSDDEADATQCSYKQTTYMANMIGSIIVNLFTNFVANEIVEGLRDLPFLTSYSADSMMFKTSY